MFKANHFLKSKTVKETLWGLSSKAYAFFAFYSLQLFLIRTLNVEDWGKWSFFFSILNIITAISDLGINLSARKFLALNNNTPRFAIILRSAILLRIAVSLLFLCIYLLSFQLIIKFSKGETESSLFLFSIPIIFFFASTEFIKSCFESLQKLKYTFAITSIEYTLKLLLTVILVIVFKNLLAIISAFSVAYFITTAVGAIILYKHYLQSKIKGIDKSEMKAIIKYALPMIFMIAVSFISLEIDVLMLAKMRGNYETGIYSTAKQIVLYLPHISIAIAMSSSPFFAKINVLNKKDLKRKLSKLLTVVSTIYLILLPTIGLLAYLFIPTIFGHEYHESIKPLLFLLPYTFLISHGLATGYILDYTGNALQRSINIAITVFLNITLNYFLIPQYGAQGAAVATSISQIPYFVLNWYSVYNVLK